MLEVLLALKFMFSSNIWNRLLFTPQIRQFGKSDFSALIVVREKQDLLCLQTVYKSVDMSYRLRDLFSSNNLGTSSGFSSGPWSV